MCGSESQGGGKGVFGHKTYVEAFENRIEFFATPGGAFALMFCAKGISPRAVVAEGESVREVIRSVAKFLESSDKGYLSSKHLEVFRDLHNLVGRRRVSEVKRTHCPRAWHAHDQDLHGPVLVDQLLDLLGATVIHSHVDGLLSSSSTPGADSFKMLIGLSTTPRWHKSFPRVLLTRAFPMDTPSKFSAGVVWFLRAPLTHRFNVRP